MGAVGQLCAYRAVMGLWGSCVPIGQQRGAVGQLCAYRAALWGADPPQLPRPLTVGCVTPNIPGRDKKGPGGPTKSTGGGGDTGGPTARRSRAAVSPPQSSVPARPQRAAGDAVPRGAQPGSGGGSRDGATAAAAPAVTPGRTSPPQRCAQPGAATGAKGAEPKPFAAPLPGVRLRSSAAPFALAPNLGCGAEERRGDEWPRPHLSRGFPGESGRQRRKRGGKENKRPPSERAAPRRRLRCHKSRGRSAAVRDGRRRWRAARRRRCCGSRR